MAEGLPLATIWFEMQLHVLVLRDVGEAGVLKYVGVLIEEIGRASCRERVL